MRAFDPEVVNAIWAAIEPLIPEPIDDHPLGCHRRRAPDRDCFEVILARDGMFVARRRTALWLSRVGHDRASASR